MAGSVLCTYVREDTAKWAYVSPSSYGHEFLSLSIHTVPSSDEARHTVRRVRGPLCEPQIVMMIVQLFPCPAQFMPGSTEHANWLFKHPATGVDLVSSASGFSLFGMPKEETDKQEAARDDHQDKCGESVAVQNTQQISCMDALRLLASCEGRAGTSVENKYKALRVPRKLCDAHFWLAKTRTGSVLLHDCPAVRAVALPLYAAHLRQEESETEAAKRRLR